MKRCIVFALLMLMGFCALAENEWAGYSDDELRAKINELSSSLSSAQAELDKREGNAGSSEMEVYTVKNYEFSIVRFENDNIRGQNAVKMFINWTNKSDEPTAFIYSMLSIKAFQNGKEVKRVYTLDEGISEEYMPGYGGECYYAFENTDDSEITIRIEDVLNWSDPLKLSFTIDPKSLE